MLRYTTIFICIIVRIEFSTAFILKEINPFCSLHCGNDKNELCNETCHEENSLDRFSFPLSKNEQMWFLNEHNIYRNMFAKGVITARTKKKDKSDSVANMLILNWCQELQIIAQCWAPISHGHKQKCLRTPSYSRAGQLVYVTEKLHLANTKNVLRMALEYWTRPLAKMDLKNNTFNAKETTDGVQIIWANTKEIGCGRAIDDNYQRLYIVCNYFPTGNVNGKEMYKPGTPCSECDNKVCNPEYESLCNRHEMDLHLFNNFDLISNGYNKFYCRKTLFILLLQIFIFN